MTDTDTMIWGVLWGGGGGRTIKCVKIIIFNEDYFIGKEKN